MRYRTINVFTGDIIGVTEKRKYVDPNSEIKKVMQKRYTDR